MKDFFGFLKKPDKNTIPFDPEKEYPVIRCSICTGEKVAGFKGRSDGKFREIMLIRNSADEETFRKNCGVETVKKEY